MSDKKVVLSAIQPTGDIHLGNYFGAVKNWVALQSDYQCIYGIVDYHAMTMPYDPAKLRKNTWDLVLNLVAVGIQPENLFIQSLVPEHAELCWIFNCFCSYGQLQRMTQFKDKSRQSSEVSDGFISAGLFDYPVMQAADILIYRADLVPIGKDQVQHLELTRDIALRFNQQMRKDYFVLPDPLFTKTPKIRSTADPTRKMSKSAGEKHYIDLFADSNRIRKQIKSAVTDTGLPSEGEMSVGVANLFELLEACEAHQAHAAFLEDLNLGRLRYADLKEAVAEALIELTSAFIERKSELQERKKDLRNQIKASSHEIRKRAQETVREVKELTGLINTKI